MGGVKLNQAAIHLQEREEQSVCVCVCGEGGVVPRAGSQLQGGRRKATSALAPQVPHRSPENMTVRG